MVKDLLRRADLLDKAVLHDDNTVAQGHSLGLIVGNVHKCGIDFLAQFDDFGAHLVAELGVQIGQGLVHQQHFGFADNGAADGNALTLAAGQGLGLPVQVLGDVQSGCGLLHLAVDLVFGHFPKLQGEGHIFIYSHMGVQGIALEDHCDITVFGLYVVHQFAVNVQLAF